MFLHYTRYFTSNRGLFNILVIGLIGLLSSPAAGKLPETGKEPISQAASASTEVAPNPTIENLPNDDYNAIVGRDLFSASEPAVGVDEEQPPETSSDENSKGDYLRDFRLVGTAVTGEPGSTLAIIEHINTRQQAYYHQGDRIGKNLIERIERNRIVIVTDSGSEVVSMGVGKKTGSASESASMKMEETPRSAQDSPAEIISVDNTGAASPRLRPVRRSSRYGQARLKTLAARMAREEVKPAVAETGELLQQVDVEPRNEGDQPGRN